MKFGVWALDYDGTIARDGVLDLDVRAAIHLRWEGMVRMRREQPMMSHLNVLLVGFEIALLTEDAA